MFTLRNRGSIARLAIDITNSILESEKNSEAAINIQQISGNKISILNKTGINLYGGDKITIPGVETVIG